MFATGIRRCSKVVKCGGLKILYLSGFAGSNPAIAMLTARCLALKILTFAVSFICNLCTAPVMGKTTDYRGYFSTLKELLFNPQGILDELRDEEGYGAPIGFLFKTALFVGGIFGILTLIAGVIMSLLNQDMVALLISVCVGIGIPIAMFILGLIFTFVQSIVVHLVTKLFGAVGTMDQAFKAIAYAEAPVVSALLLLVPLVNILAVIPFVLGLPIWRIVLSIFGISTFYDLSKGQATGVYFIHLAVLAVLTIIAVMMFFLIMQVAVMAL